MPAPTTRCCRAIGGRQDAAELTEALRLGAESPGAIARRSGASKTSLQRHARECLGLAGGAAADSGRPTSDPEANQSADLSGSAVEIVESLPQVVAAEVVGIAAKPAQPPLNNARVSDPKQNVKPESAGRKDGSTQTYRPAPTTNHHRRPLPTCPDVLSGFEARATYIADLLSRAKWDRDAEAEHAVRWGVGAGTIAQYKRAATVVLAADRGALREQVEVSVAYGTAQRDQAARMAERNEEIAAEARSHAEDTGRYRSRSDNEDEPDADPTKALQTETFALKHARDYRKLVLEWQQHLDTLTGVLVTKAPSIQINALVVAQTPEFEAVMRCVLDELQATPKIRAKVIERVRGEIDRQRAASATPVRRMATG